MGQNHNLRNEETSPWFCGGGVGRVGVVSVGSLLKQVGFAGSSKRCPASALKMPGRRLDACVVYKKVAYVANVTNILVVAGVAVQF